MLPITPEQKTTLVEEILQTEGLAQRADRSRGVLRYLLNRHLENPDNPPTRPEIFKAVWADEFHSEPKATVGSAVARLRTALDEYFRGPGAHQMLRLEVPVGGHALVFKRVLDSEENSIQWFWGSYLAAAAQSRFGLIPEPPFGIAVDRPSFSIERIGDGWPDEARMEPIYPILRIFNNFQKLLLTSNNHLEICDAGWERDPTTLLNSFNTILLTSAASFPTHDVNRFPLGRLTSLRHLKHLKRNVPLTPKGLDLIRDVFPACMYRDPAGTPAILVRDRYNESRCNFHDSKERRHILLTRCTMPISNKQVTLISAGQHPFIFPASMYLTTAAGVSRIAARPEFIEVHQKATAARLASGGEPAWPGLAPLDFQVVFSVPAIYPVQLDVSGMLSQVTVEYCEVVDRGEIE